MDSITMKKIFYWVSTILQVIFLITACGIQFFSMKKMGMMRYVVYINHTWEAQYPIATLKYAAIAFLVVLCVIILLHAKIKRGKYINNKKALPMLIMEVIMTLAFVIFILAYSTESYLSYYFISLILVIIVLIQDIKILVYLKR
ncbi:hypothetical protein [Clostridium ljungdahlii]|uniref:Uncharacterized protein n=1 Tax=Clostridium ljungdahlii TaxID=1538 RepID=A0A162LC73_9CLOT|nr:hypothetical protein [Clostridium ljungdahlii]OAA91636.1 hypothetical protein WY13_00601 [Clostridium ljungdahlii]